MEMIDNNPDKKWSWIAISYIIPNITMDIINNNLDKSWTSRKTRGFAQSAKVVWCIM